MRRILSVPLNTQLKKKNNDSFVFHSLNYYTTGIKTISTSSPCFINFIEQLILPEPTNFIHSLQNLSFSPKFVFSTYKNVRS